MYREWQLIQLTIVLMIAFYTDLKYQLIPNAITLPSIFLGLALNVFFRGAPGFIDGLLGILLGLVLFIIPFIIGGLGGGDVKLIMAIGAIMGMQFNLECIVATVIIGALISLVLILNQRKLKRSLVTVCRYIISTILLQSLKEIEQTELNMYFPYGIAISLGTIVTLLSNWRSQ